MSTDEKATTSSLHADRPIRRSIDDKLGRSGFAKSIAHQIQRAPRGDSYVLGLVGPWGSGKTSILNMIEEELRSDSSMLFLSFNPWLFSGHKELVAHFFHEIAAQIRDHDQGDLRDIWRGFEGYSRLLRPLRAIPGAETPGAEAREPSLRRQREVLNDALDRARHRLVVVIDDLDRLENEEIRDVMKLVRLLADFPNTIYLLSYDETRVVEALGGEDKQRGRSFLEKIVQVAHHVPEIQNSELCRILETTVELILLEVPHLRGPRDFRKTLQWLYTLDLFDNLREIYRFANSIRISLGLIAEEIVIGDLLALEAVRVLEPNVMTDLITNRDLHIPSSDRHESPCADPERWERAKHALFSRGCNRAARIEKLLALLFPTIGGDFSRARILDAFEKRNAASPQVFQIYVDKSLPVGEIETSIVRQLLENMSNIELVSSILESMEPWKVVRLLDRLEHHPSALAMDNNGDILRCVLDQMPRLSNIRNQIRAMQPKETIYWFVERLLLQFPFDLRIKIIERQFSHIQCLSARLLLMEAVELPSEPTQALVVTELLKNCEIELARSLVMSPVSKIFGEPELLRLFLAAHPHDEHGIRKVALTCVNDDRCLVHLCESSIVDIYSNSYCLDQWDGIAMFIEPDVIKKRLESIASPRNDLHLDEPRVHAIDATLKYIQGWRPIGLQRPQAVSSEPDTKHKRLYVKLFSNKSRSTPTPPSPPRK